MRLSQKAGFDPQQVRDPHTGEWIDEPGLSDLVEALSPAEVLGDRALSNWRAKPGGNFTEDDWDLLQAGTSPYIGTPRSYAINNFLRTGDDFNAFDMSAGEMRGTIGKLDTAFGHAGPIGAPVRVYRGVGGSLGEMGLPDDAVGKTFTDRGFGSTSADSGFTELFSGASRGEAGIRFTLTIDPRVKAIWGANPDEAELLVERGVRYVIRSARKEGETWQVEADVLPPK